VRDHAVYKGRDKPFRGLERRYVVWRDNAVMEFRGGGVPMQFITVPQMEPEQPVKLLIIGRVEIIPVPPAPVAPLGNIDLFPGEGVGLCPL
jgi:hypothetical protein